MKTVPQNVSDDVKNLNPHLYGAQICSQDGPTIDFSGPDHIQTPTKLRKRLRQSSKKMNALEADFQSYLKLQYSHVYYEPMRIRLCNGVVYIPDFMVTCLTKQVMFFEVKGDRQIQDDSSVKLKMAAQQYPLFKFVLVWREYGGWKEQEILQ